MLIFNNFMLHRDDVLKASWVFSCMRHQTTLCFFIWVLLLIKIDLKRLKNVCNNPLAASSSPAWLALHTSLMVNLICMWIQWKGANDHIPAAWSKIILTLAVTKKLCNVCNVSWKTHKRLHVQQFCLFNREHSCSSIYFLNWNCTITSARDVKWRRC